jgi:hypothetical protein
MGIWIHSWRPREFERIISKCSIQSTIEKRG